MFLAEKVIKHWNSSAGEMEASGEFAEDHKPSPSPWMSDSQEGSALSLPLSQDMKPALR